MRETGKVFKPTSTKKQAEPALEQGQEAQEALQYSSVDAALVSQMADFHLRIGEDGRVLHCTLSARLRQSGPILRPLRPGDRFDQWLVTSARVTARDLLAEAWSSKQLCERILHHAINGPDDFSMPVHYFVQKIEEGAEGSYLLAMGLSRASEAGLRHELLRAQKAQQALGQQTVDQEARMALLFDLVDEPLLFVEINSMRVLRANRAAQLRFGWHPDRVVRPLSDCIAQPDEQRLKAEIHSRSAGEAPGRMSVVLAEREAGALKPSTILVHPFRSQVLIRVLPPFSALPGEEGPGADRADWQIGVELVSLLKRAPAPLLVIAPNQTVYWCNDAAASLLGRSSAGALLGASVHEMIGDDSVAFHAMMQHLQQEGALYMHETVLQATGRGARRIWVSGMVCRTGRRDLSVICLHDAERMEESAQAEMSMQEALEIVSKHAAAFAGEVTLKDVLRDVVEPVERALILRAMEITEGNKRRAAELLGLSRQGLYSKLRAAHT
ncbi:MAG: PAS domain-containing protein [Neomegalonema sp.]|nr:PAS domain-containing protein [Neomegalonema sp.]